MITIFPCGSRRSKGVPSGSGVFLRLLMGELWDPYIAKIFAYGKWLYPYIMQQHSASDLDQRCLNTRNSTNGCTFPPNNFAPTPKITPKPYFRGPFNAKSIIRRAVRKSHVNGATMEYSIATAMGWRPSVADWAMVCLLAASWVQLSTSEGNGWQHNALRHHWLMLISCHFRHCKALLVTSLTHDIVGRATASVQTFTFTFTKVKLYSYIGIGKYLGVC